MRHWRPTFMVRRALFGFCPALLTALVFLCGTPNASIGGSQVEAAAWNSRVAPAPIATRDLSTRDLCADILDNAIDQLADDDNHDTPVDRVAAAVVWPVSAFERQILHPSDRAGPTHRPCAADPRAPPTA
jgi:hypothetical protein